MHLKVKKKILAACYDVTAPPRWGVGEGPLTPFLSLHFRNLKFGRQNFLLGKKKSI